MLMFLSVSEGIDNNEIKYAIILTIGCGKWQQVLKKDLNIERP